jgi:long-chain acyl-CoA synthetase
MANIAQYLFNRARSQPSAPAVTFADRSLSFGELVERSSRIAGALRGSAGLAPGDRVVLWMENRSEFLELLFACWTAGLCAVPVNAKLHTREALHIVGDCGARAVFTSESLAGDLTSELKALDAPPLLHVVGSQAYEQLVAASPIPCAQVSATDLAWIFYTSGTTGRPKGAMLSHRNLLSMSYAYYADIERVEPGDVKLHAAPLSHGSGLYGLPHLLGGGHQVIHNGFEPQDVLEAFQRYRNLTIFAAPTMVTRLVAAAGSASAFPGLRTLYYGGGPMYVSDLVKALDLFGPCLYQLYGQGESPMTISGLSKREHVGDRSAAHLALLGSCGTPRTGVEVRVVDDSGKDLPAGEIGEVVTRSDCVMAGYWNNPSATAAALRDGWLWTGDVGSLDERGYLTLRDRSKDMIISGGTNIYPREIEEVLLQHPAVLECSVVGRPHPDWGEEVIAFVVPRPEASLETQELDALCLSNIARFKRPREYRIVTALPKNNYGKILKTSLRDQLLKERNHA